jgi:myo-inositol-1(or 4)-monophosphatase
MKKEVNWFQILVRCKDKITEEIAPILRTIDEPQPDLGIGAGGDHMKKIDIAAEKAIVSTMKKAEISFTLISEESGVREYGQNPDEFYVTTDPIDGTTNLMRGVPFYATSIAVSTEPVLNKIHAALVADLFHGSTYTAQKGHGSFRNNQKMKPSTNNSLEEAVIGIDLNGYKVARIAPQLTRLIEKTKHIRHFGANALELCYVADGTTDAFIDIRGKLRATDMAAAWLIIREAGAIITAPDGKSLNFKLDPKQKAEFVASANHTIHENILSLTKPEKDTK